MSIKKTLLTTVVGLGLTAGIAAADSHSKTITIATVNNGDMVRMQGYTDQFTEETGIAVER